MKESKITTFKSCLVEQLTAGISTSEFIVGRINDDRLFKIARKDLYGANLYSIVQEIKIPALLSQGHQKLLEGVK